MRTEAAIRERAATPVREARARMVLQPVSHPQIGEIRIAGGLFAIGRNEEPFASRLGDAAARLSRRHARIFEEGGKYFIADLGSRNGTRINRRPVHGGPAVLVSSDVVTFGGEVSFKVMIEHDPPADRTVVRPSPAMRLTLTPVDPGSGLETLVVERFPFLVARVGGPFEQYSARFPDAVRKLSRRHAVLALKGDDVFVEDLESSNGTYVSGKRLDERAHRLANGDTVMFGSDEFSYTVRVDSPGEEVTRLAAPRAATADTPRAKIPTAKPVAESAHAAFQPASAAQSARVRESQSEAPAAHAPASGAADAVHSPEPQSPAPDASNRTRFVSSADSFLNVFCAEDERSDAQPGSDDGEAAEVELPPASGGALQKLRVKLQPVWRLLTNGSSVNRKMVWATVGALAFLVVGGVGAYLVSMERRAIGSLLESGDYAGSARTANSYLQERPDDNEASAWAEEALIRATVPTWIEHIEAGRYDEAADYLRTQRERHANIAGGVRMLDVLAWAGEMEAHMAERGGASAPITLFQHEDQIRSLVEAWDKDSFRRQQILEQIATREPKFEPVQRRIYARLRTLRGDDALYVKAIGEFKVALTAALAKNDWPLIDKLLADFAAGYPRVHGLDVLQADLTQYRNLVLAVEKKDLSTITRLSRSVQFRVPLVAQHAEKWIAQSTPPEPVLAQHAEAARAWKAGRHSEAIVLLQPLTDGPWGSIAEQQIARYQKIQADYDALVEARGKEEYWDRLLALRGALHPSEDEHLLKEIEPDFLAHRERLAPRLDASLQSIRATWAAYQNAGGIPGVLRVEGRLSDRFSDQARRLSSAYTEVTSSARTHELLQIEPSAEWRALHGDILVEVQRQRRWLEDLNIVLEPALLRAKLDLLPEISESPLWVQSTTAQEVD